MDKKKQVFFYLILQVAFIVLMVDSRGFSLSRVIVPLIVFCMATALIILKILTLKYDRLTEILEPKVFKARNSKGASVEPAVQVEKGLPVGITLLWVIGTVGTVYLLGFILGIGISTAVYLGIINRLKLVTVIAGTLLLPAFLYLVFQVGLQINLY